MKERLSGEERRQQIVEAAIDLFSRKGFRGTTTREIAEAAGISEAMIFKHFATKQELYSAIIEAKSETEELLASAARAASRKDDPGVFRPVDSLVAARGFIGMTVHYLLIHELFGVKRPPRSSPEEVVQTFVSIFLRGIER